MVDSLHTPPIIPSPPPCHASLTVQPLLSTKMQNQWIFSGDQQTRFVKIRIRNCVPKAFYLGTLLSERQVLTAEKRECELGESCNPLFMVKPYPPSEQ